MNVIKMLFVKVLLYLYENYSANLILKSEFF